MLIDLILALTILSGLTFVGLPLVPKFIDLTGFARLLLACLTSLTLLVCLSSWIAAFNLSIKVLWFAILAFALYAVAKASTIKNDYGDLSALKKSLKRTIPCGGLVGLFVAYLQNPSIFGQFLSFRNGPDLVGWTKAVQFFCSDSKLIDLENRIVSNLGASRFTDTLVLPGALNESFLYRLPSFSDQITAEFLLGAHRTGLPAFLGSVCNAIPNESAIRIVAAFQCAIIMLIFWILYEYFLRKNLSHLHSVFFALAGSLNFAILSVMLEGGLGQILLLPYLAFLFFLIFNKENKIYEFGFIVFLTLTLSFSSYLDFAYFFGIMSLFCLILFKVKQAITLGRLLSVYGIASSLALTASWPILTSLPRLFWERFFGHPGGWNMGRFPTLTDLLGLSIWLPSDSVSVFSNQFILVLILSLVSTYLIVSAFANSPREILFIFIGYLLGYFAILFLVYSKSPSNNYSLFKFGAYFGLFAPFFFFELRKVKLKVSNMHSSRVRFIGMFKQELAVKETKAVKNKQKVSSLANSLVVVSLLSSTIWSFGWTSNRQFSISETTSSKLQPYIAKFDVVASGFTGAGYAKLALLGDVHYLTRTRGFDVPVNVSFPAREKIYLLHPDLCNSAPQCLTTKDGADFQINLLSSFKEFDVYK